MSSRFYGISIANNSDTPIVGGTIMYQSNNIEFGWVVPQSQRGYGAITADIPETVTLKWAYEGGKTFTNRVEVRRFVKAPRSFEGRIVFQLNLDGNAVVKIKDQAPD